jgi:hypothetical protein
VEPAAFADDGLDDCWWRMKSSTSVAFRESLESSRRASVKVFPRAVGELALVEPGVRFASVRPSRFGRITGVVLRAIPLVDDPESAPGVPESFSFGSVGLCEFEIDGTAVSFGTRFELEGCSAFSEGIKFRVPELIPFAVDFLGLRGLEAASVSRCGKVCCCKLGSLGKGSKSSTDFFPSAPLDSRFDGFASTSRCD